MLPIKRILYPTDFSPCARGALACALDLAVRSNAELHVLHVMEEEPQRATSPDPMRPEEADLDIRLHKTVNAQLGRLDRVALERLRVTYSLGHDVAPAPAILRYADTHRIDLVVIGTHGRRGLLRLLLGSVATEVLHAGGCDVLTVPAREETVAEPAWARHVLVPLDLTESSAQVLQEAGALADLLQARLTVLHVIEPAPLPVFSVGQGGTFGTLLPNLRQAGRARLERLREEAGVPAQTGVFVDEGSPALVIATFAEEQNIDLIVMAARSRQGVKQSVRGSVTERVVRRASCPVWILRPHVAGNLEETAQPAAEKPEMTA